MLRRPHFRRRTYLIAGMLLIGLIAGLYYWHHHIPDVTDVLGPPPEVFHDARLDMPVTITFNGVKLTHALQRISELTHVPIKLDASLVARDFSDLTSIYLHAHRLPARLVIEHLMKQKLSDDEALCIETPAGLRIVLVEQTLADITTHSFNVGTIADWVMRPYRRPPDWWNWLGCFTEWVSEKFGRSKAIFALPIIIPDTPRGEVCRYVGDVLQRELPHCDFWRPVGLWWTATWVSEDQWVVNASADQHLRIYQTMWEFYLGLAYDMDSAQLHPASDEYRRAAAWLASQPESWKQAAQEPASWLRRAERDGVSLSVCRPYNNPPDIVAWMVDEHGVVIAGDSGSSRKFCVLRTYNIRDLLWAQRNDLSRGDQIDVIVNDIKKYVEPDRWRPIGLDTCCEAIDSLIVVCAPMEMQDEVAAYFRQRRAGR